MAALSACGLRAAAPAPIYEMPAAATAAPAMPRELAGAAPQLPAAPASDFAKSSVENQPAGTDRLVIKNAELTIVVADVNARVSAIQAMADAMGGFVVSANVYQTTAQDGTPVPQAQVVVRVPVARLTGALDQIKKDTVDIKSESQSGQDVTDQYVDLQSRLTAKQAAADQLTEIMKDATKTQDVLAVYNQLEQIESDIEVLKGQIKYTEQSAALSAISVTIIAEKTVKPLEVGGWKPQGVARDAIQSLIYFEQDFVDFMIRFVLLILPVLITIGIPLFLVFLLLRWLVRLLRKPKPAVEAPAPKKK
jgi:hypothetical protein